MKKRSIAIDGPSGAGKSTLAKLLAEEFGFLYVDTGAIYRTLGVYAKKNGVDPQDSERVCELLETIEIRMAYGEDGLQHMLLNGEDVTTAIREHIISDYASKVSAIPKVRAFLLDMQRDLAKENDVIMDGRDIGTKVLPDADLKLFLTATPEDRARRRCEDLRERGQQANYEDILRDVMERDDRDMNRAAAPLRQADDAILVDTTGDTLAQSKERLRAIVKERLGL